MDNLKICIGCQDFEENVGHEAKWCPNIVCQKCKQKGHTKITCMLGHEDLKTLPNEILLKIIGYICDDTNSTVKYPTTFDDLEEFSSVSKRFQETCEAQKKILIEKTMKIQDVTLESLPLLLLPVSYSNISKSNTEMSQEEHATKILLAKPNLTSTLIDQREENIKKRQRQREWELVKIEHIQTSKQNQFQQKNLQKQQVQYQQVSFEYKLKYFKQQGLIKELGQYQTQQQRQQPLWQSLSWKVKLYNHQLKQMQVQIRQFKVSLLEKS